MSLELKSVSVMRGKARILKDISGRLEPGQIVGLIGPNGTGKSTLVNAIATLYPFGGTIHWKGRPVKLGEIGYMPQQCHVRADISVTETVLLGRHEGLSWRVDNAMVDEAIGVLDEFGIGHLHSRSMNTLSGGEQQRLCIARAVVHQPSLLIADEPSANLDRAYALDIMELFKTFHEAGTTVIVAAHDETLMADYGHRILRLQGGRLA